MPRPGTPYPPKVTPRDAWTLDFIVAVQSASDLREGKFLKAIADQLYRQDGAAMTGDEAARAWLKRRGAKP
ncbi:MAG TPA: hypothetical protein VNU71_10065 [Burkholderiaceae bacterium]|nr:hypothetical protein [Burkholderiaceae bacterium]